MATNPYVKTVWVNDEAPPINDTNLNHIEQGIYDATAGLIQAEADLALHTTDINTLSDDLDTAEGNITTLQGQVGSHTIARDVLANEYTNAQIDTKIAEVTPVWGSITGTLSNQTDLQNALDSAGKVKAVDGFNPDTTTGNVTTERVLTQAQYNALSEAEKNNGMTYYISDGEGGGGGSTTAAQVSYNNTTSGLSATNVQGAIDEVVSTALHVNNIVSAAGSGTEVAAYSSVDIDTGRAPEGTTITFAGRYGGHPRAVITNIWIAGGTIRFTSFNPTNASITLGSCTILEFFTK